MTSAALAAAILITVTLTGFIVGALGAFCDDTNPDW